MIDFDSNSNASSEAIAHSEEYQVYGPTTRRKWSEWIAQPAPTPIGHARNLSVTDTENVSVS